MVPRSATDGDRHGNAKIDPPRTLVFRGDPVRHAREGERRQMASRSGCLFQRPPVMVALCSNLSCRRLYTLQIDLDRTLVGGAGSPLNYGGCCGANEAKPC